MLNEHKARALRYDAATDQAFVELGPRGAESRTVAALLLLDAKGFLVGVDLGGEGLARAVVLLGSFESVDRTVSADVVVAYGAGGEPAEVRVGDARSAIRAVEPSPYL